MQQRKKTVISNLKRLLLEKKELTDGYAYRFTGHVDMVDLVTDFVKTERFCCDFFNFNIAVSNDNILWLTISGPEGTKDFITAELEL